MKEKETTSELGVYRPFVECGNCDLAQEIKIDIGVLISNKQCPNCGNKTLHLVRRNLKTKTEYAN